MLALSSGSARNPGEPGYQNVGGYWKDNNVHGSPPFQGVLKHPGWRARTVQLPALPASRDDTSVLSPAEVEIP